MWSFSSWRRRRTLARHPVAEELWQQVRKRLPILDGLSTEQGAHLRDACVLFLNDKHLSALPGVELDDEQRLFLAAQAQLPLLSLGELNWYQAFTRSCCTPTTSSARSAIAMQVAWNMSGMVNTAARPGCKAR
ncbi:hypothetical protein PSA5_29740 [Pseudomonas syringae pv. actinidiae]|nr:hypothetical protein PSA5_29740 [Pseudomonas syringae pv. actinidiae]